MRIVCPSCNAAYEVPASVLDAGRTLRCARCGTDFSVGLVPPPPPEVVVMPADEAARLSPVIRPKLKPRPAVLAGWVCSLVLLSAGVWAAFAWRQPIMAAWPASARLYRML